NETPRVRPWLDTTDLSAGETVDEIRPNACLDQPGAAVPVRLDASREALYLEVQLFRQAGEAGRHVQLESIRGERAERHPMWWATRRAQHGDAAAAATSMGPDVEPAARCLDQGSGLRGGDDVHRLMIADRVAI